MRARASLASFSAFRGDRASAERLIGEVIGSGYMDHHVAYSLGVAYAQLGRLEEARTWLDRAAGTGFPCYPWYMRDPLLEPVLRDPSSRAFLERLRVQWEAAKTRYAGAKRAVAASRPLFNAPWTVALRPYCATASPARNSVPATGRVSLRRASMAPTPP